MFSRILSIAAVISVAMAINGHERGYYEGKFFEWLNKFQVKPLDGNHFVRMLENFIVNEDKIELHNSKSNATYTLGHNKFSHMNYNEWRSYVQLGLARRAKDVTPISVHEAPKDPSSLAASVDWVSEGAVTGVKDQGQCGSCWSFSTTGSLEGAYKIKNNNLLSFSEQNLVDCDNFIHGGSDLGCNGGLMDNAFDWVAKNGGICLEADYPYVSGTTEKRGSCVQDSCSKVAGIAPSSHVDVAINSDSAMMSALMQQPVSIAIEADQEDFQLYSSGVFTASCGTSLDHGVLAVGYGTYTDGTDYYKVKNSWGTSWGMDGYILLARGISQVEGQCGMLSGPPSYPVL